MKLLVPIDHSEGASAALEHAMSHHPEAALLVAHVIDPSEAGLFGEGYATRYVAEGRERDADTILEEAAERTRDHGGPVELERAVGKPAREILSLAEDNDIDGIVMGSHGRSGLTRVLLGSVAESVVRRAGVPVTIVR